MQPGRSLPAFALSFAFLTLASAKPFGNFPVSNSTTTSLGTSAGTSSASSATSSTNAFPTMPAAGNSTTTGAQGTNSTITGAQGTNSTTSLASNSTAALDPNAVSCQLALPSNALTVEGLSTPWQLLAPCSQSVNTQQAFAEAAVIDSTGQISIYHPLIIDAGKTPAAAPVVPNIPDGASVALFFGFNGATLQLVDTNGQDTNASPSLAAMKCVNGLPGTTGDVFGQVSWCNTDAFFGAANTAIASGQTQVPPLGTDNNGMDCPSSHSFELIDQDQSDNLPTQYLLMVDGSTMQSTAANKAKFPSATEIDNASDEALLGAFVDPAIGCTPYQVPSLDDPGKMVASLATQELQAGHYQKAPIALVPLNDPDTVLTSNGDQSMAKTNAYRQGMNMPLIGNGGNTDDGSGTTYCNNMITIQPPWLAQNQKAFAAVATPDAGVGNNLFTFLCNRFLQSITNLGCTPTTNTGGVTCQLDGNGAATSCTISATGGSNSTASATGSTGGTQTTSPGGGGTGTTSHKHGETAGFSNLPSSNAGSTSLVSATATATTSGGFSFPTQSNGGIPSQSNGGTQTQSNGGSIPTQSNGGFSFPTQSNGAIPSQSNGSTQTQSNGGSIPTLSNGGFGSSPTTLATQVQSIGSSMTASGVVAPTTFLTATLGTTAAPPPLSQFSAMPTSSAVAVCTSAAVNQNCFHALGWQLCRL